MNHAQRRLQEIRSKPPKAKKARKPHRRKSSLRMPHTDAESLRFIAGQMRRLGWPNFAAELDRIADTSLPIEAHPQAENGVVTQR